MLKYYAYYSVGGYKNLFLGTSAETDEATYYLPLTGVLQQKAEEGDKEAAAKLEATKDLPKIKLVTADNMLGLPKETIRYFSRGGYSEMLTVNPQMETILIIRDIDSHAEDDNGRKIPFLFAIVADNGADAKRLASLASFAAANGKEIRKELSGMFSFDAKHNGLKFDLKAANKLVNTVAAKYPAEIVGETAIQAIDCGTPGLKLLVAPNGKKNDFIFNELNIKPDKAVTFGYGEIADATDEKKREKAIARAKALAKHRQMLKMVYLVGGIALLALVVWCIMNNISAHDA